MLDPEPLRTLRPETKGQAAACPDRTQAIPCKVQQSSSEDRSRAPLRARSTGQPGYLTVTKDNLLPELTCG
jgi:hypothetical protein